jgi:hypothetical protein
MPEPLSTTLPHPPRSTSVKQPGRGAVRNGGHKIGDSGLVERVGPSALVEGAGWLDCVHDKADVSLLARRRWLQAWADGFSGWEPWVLAAVADDEVRAVAPLARRRARWGVEVVSLGDGALAESPVAACDDGAVAGLVDGLVDALHASDARGCCACASSR